MLEANIALGSQCKFIHPIFGRFIFFLINSLNALFSCHRVKLLGQGIQGFWLAGTFFKGKNTNLSLDKIISTYKIQLEVAERLELHSVFEIILFNELTRMLLDGFIARMSNILPQIKPNNPPTPSSKCILVLSPLISVL